MNLLIDPWIPVRNRDGTVSYATVAHALSSDDVVGTAAVRPDLDGALIQFLIGLVQTVFPPESDEAWALVFEQGAQPTESIIQEQLQAFVPAFELVNETGPAFMQDFDHRLVEKAEPKDILSLMLETPGGNTLENNSTLFVKPSVHEGVCESVAAQLLLLLQINAPSGGAGHRTGVRGGGPLTTLIWPRLRKDRKTPTSLFEKLWCNVLQYGERVSVEKTLPWCSPTITSEKGQVALGGMLLSYWATPRRIRLVPSKAIGTCSLDPNAPQGALISQFVTVNYGANYPSDRFTHPLSPYYRSKDDAWLPLHARSTFTYRDWLALACDDSATVDAENRPATVISASRERSKALAARFALDGSSDARVEDSELWAFGFATDNAKILQWHSAVLPALIAHDGVPLTAEQASEITKRAKRFVRATTEATRALAMGVSQALAKASQSQIGKDISSKLVDATEPLFYKLIYLPDGEPVRKQWFTELARTATKLFDEATENRPLSGDIAVIERVVEARVLMRRQLYFKVKGELELSDKSKSDKAKKRAPKSVGAK
jgi:CRISPR system Cascade subunit CasA